MWTGEVYDEEEDLMEDPVDYLASEAGIDLLDFCVDYLETSGEGAEDSWVDEDELQVSLPFSDCLYWCETYQFCGNSLPNGRPKIQQQMMSLTQKLLWLKCWKLLLLGGR
jgi:hypothetical protein